jgi:AcrR family transcriptional regulator
VASRKTASRSTYHHGDLARTLREEAVKLIREVGPEGVALRELARRIGVNHASVYRHYADKEALVAAVAQDGWTELAAAMHAAVTGDDVPADPAARLVRIGAAYARYALAHPAHYGVMTGPRLNEAGRFPSLEVPIDDAFQLLISEIERGRKLGAFADGGTAQDWALRVWMFVHGYVSLVMARRVQVKPSRVEEYFERMLTPLVGAS